jgi:hypothetical protein
METRPKEPRDLRNVGTRIGEDWFWMRGKNSSISTDLNGSLWLRVQRTEAAQ